MFSQITALFMTMRAWDILDILVVTLFLYNIYIFYHKNTLCNIICSKKAIDN